MSKFAKELNRRTSKSLSKNSEGSSDVDGRASLDPGMDPTSRSDGVQPGTSTAGLAPPGPDHVNASSLGPLCQAIRKKDGEPCSWPAVKSGNYAGKYCRLHVIEASKRAKRGEPEPSPYVETLLRCWHCGQVEGKTPLGYEEGYDKAGHRVYFHVSTVACQDPDGDCGYSGCDLDEHHIGCFPLLEGWGQCCMCRRAVPKNRLEQVWVLDPGTEQSRFARVSSLDPEREYSVRATDDGATYTLWACEGRCGQ